MNYAKLATDVLGMIARFGESVTYRQHSDGAPADPAKPWEPGPSSTVNNTVNMVFAFNRFQIQRMLQRKKNSTLPDGLEYGLMGQQAFTPKLKDEVIRGAKTFRVAYIDTVQPGDTTLLYTVGLSS